MGSTTAEIRQLQLCAQLAAALEGDVPGTVDVLSYNRGRSIAVLVTSGGEPEVTRAYYIATEYALQLGAEPLARKLISKVKGGGSCRD